MSRAKQLGEDRAAFFEGWIAARPHLAERFVGAERITPVRATGPFATTSRRGWASGAALVGDAADFFDPFTGEGIYAALRGGELLAPYLLEALRRPARDERRVLSGYDKARKVTAISANFLQGASDIPTPKSLFGADLTTKPDGSAYKMARYPKAGCWLAYSKTAGASPLITITLQKIE